MALKRRTLNNRRRRRTTKRIKGAIKKGGFANEYEIINLSATSGSAFSLTVSSDQLSPIISKIDTENYDLVYISVGSKYNEQKFTILGTTITANSAYQVVPFFLIPRTSRKRVLCIAIDQFNESANDIQHTLTDIKKYYKPEDLSHIDLFLINTIDARNNINRNFNNNPDQIAQTQYIGNIIDTISEKLEMVNFDPKKYMVCNYVKFKNPIGIETNINNQMPIQIKNALTKHKYGQCYYEWLGYSNTLFFDYITNYVVNPNFTMPIRNTNINLAGNETFVNSLGDEQRTPKKVDILYGNEYMFYNNDILYLYPLQFKYLFPIKPPRIDPDNNINIQNIEQNTNDFVYSLGELVEHVQQYNSV